MYARVVVDTGSTSSMESLTYEVPDGLAEKTSIGSCVLVPLASRQAIGYVVGLEEKPAVEKTREIMAELDSPVRLSEDALRLAEWISEQYLSPLSRVVSAMLPGVMSCRVQARVSVLDESVNLTPSERALLDRVKASGPSPTVESLASGRDRSAISRTLRSLENKSAITRSWELISPAGKPRIMRGVRVASGVVVDDPLIESLPQKQSEALRAIFGLGRDASVVELTQSQGLSASAVSALERKGILESADITFRRQPVFAQLDVKRVTLSEEQQSAVDQICASLNSGAFARYLLFGVTASGKTEVYLRCIERALELGKTSLVLLPEIALTTQVMNIFKSHFGQKVAVLHSALSAGERFDEWARIEEGEARVVLGARSAVFAPLKDLGLVIVDEEHESSYKQDISPRYNGRDVAVRRAEVSGAVAVLGSATPSIESYYSVLSGHGRLITMLNRVQNRPMPKVHIADLRQEYSQGRVTIFSRILEEGIRDRLGRGEQVILLQNRRAYSTFLLCRDCGFVYKCPNCAVSLKFHSAQKKVTCHHCDYTVPAPDVCPACQSTKLKGFGIGTERVEEETKKTFEGARVIRMDRDTTARKGAHGAILSAFRQGEADILVGTQMIAKGLDFPNVTLVGIISADTSLNLPDFRASERTYQLVSQVAGRSGRGTQPGEVVIQTFDPEHDAIVSAVQHDYPAFYESEVITRHIGYPPFTSLVNIVSRDSDERAAGERLRTLLKGLKSTRMSDRKGIEIIGPQPAVLSKLRGEYRWHMILRSADRGAVLRLLKLAFETNPNLRRQVTVDVDPVSML